MGVSHDHAEKCLMSCDVFGRAIKKRKKKGDLCAQHDVMVVEVAERCD